eukprot:m.43063 g.43063  ORF g.43063 m.43063 type:complete len:95 (-) comp12173_c0_seq1:201-485(-)
MSYGGDSRMGGGLGNKQEIMQQVQQEMLMSQMQGLVQRMSLTCFEKCIEKPGTSLSSSEQSCLAKCMDRYLETTTVVTNSYAGRVQQMASQGEH